MGSNESERDALSSIKYEFGDLPPLHTRPVGAVRRALELEGHLPALDLRHPLLAKITQLVPVQNRAGRVEGVGLDLHRVLEEDGEGVAGAVGEVLDDGDAERHALALQLDLGLVLGGAAAGAVQPEAGDEDALVHGELDAVAAAAVSPLIAAVGAGLKAVAPLRRQPFAWFADELQLRFLGRCVPQEDIVGFVERQHAGLRHAVGEIIERHRRDPYKVDVLS